MLSYLGISGTALQAQRTRMNVIANNLANMNVIGSTDGRFEPYRRKLVVFEPRAALDGDPLQGVSVKSVEDDPAEFRLESKPGHPYADAQGYVLAPNVNPMIEMVDMIEATRAYEANVTAMESTKSLFGASLRILA